MADTSDYTPEMTERAKGYLEKILKDNRFPSIAGLAVDLGKARSTIYKWSTEPDKKEFSDILERILTWQEIRLVENGLNGTFNSTITKLILSKHGYVDKQETDLTSGGKPLPILGNVQLNQCNKEDNESQEAN